NYYDINQADKFEQLFGDLYIGKHPTPKHNTYLVLNLDFSGLDTTSEDAFAVSLSGKIQDNIRDFLNSYKHLFPEGDIYNKQIDIEQPGVASLRKAFSAAKSIGKKMFIIIDEYDHFANDMIAQGTFAGDNLYKHTVRANGIIRDFYETLKEGNKTVIDRVILTGITPIMLDDITSGFNIADNLTLKKRYNEMLGFTQEEVNTLMKETGIDPNMINVNIELLYNGYLFHPEGKYRVYNPTMMLYLLNSISKDETIENIIDDNLKMDYGRLQLLVQHEKNRAQLIQIAEDNAIGSEIIHRFPIDKLHDNKYFVSLLFYLGLLTINKREEGLLQLKIPNHSIRTIFWEYIEEITKESNVAVSIDMEEQRRALHALAYKGDPYPFIDCISKNIFSRLSNRDLRNFNEKYIKIMILNGLFQSNMYLPITEIEVEHGYVDIYMQRHFNLPDIPYEWVWEVKYVKKEDAKSKKNAVLKKTREKSYTQLQKYRNSYFFAGRTDVRYLSVIFIGKDKYEIEEIK
ncbi:MAG: ATP-binding protein, partial [Bacteroidales bacterium]|nr:ATP-binding protein [Bacteroidales bacterium]